MKNRGIVSLWMILFLSLFPALANAAPVQEGSKEESPSVEQLYKKKMYEKTREQFKKSLAIDPDYFPASEALTGC